MVVLRRPTPRRRRPPAASAGNAAPVRGSTLPGAALSAREREAQRGAECAGCGSGRPADLAVRVKLAAAAAAAAAAAIAAAMAARWGGGGGGRWAQVAVGKRRETMAAEARRSGGRMAVRCACVGDGEGNVDEGQLARGDGSGGGMEPESSHR
jgi:hypothetical protein